MQIWLGNDMPLIYRRFVDDIYLMPTAWFDYDLLWCNYECDDEIVDGFEDFIRDTEDTDFQENTLPRRALRYDDDTFHERPIRRCIEVTPWDTGAAAN